jgi:hypothetical protein
MAVRRAGLHEPGLRQAGAASDGGGGDSALVQLMADTQAAFQTQIGEQIEENWRQRPGLLMALAQCQGGNLLVPNVDVSIGVPASPAGIQRRAVFTIPRETTEPHTITLLTANAEIGSQIWLVIAALIAPGGIYSILDGGGNGLIGGGPADEEGAGGWLAHNAFGERDYVHVEHYVFDGTNWADASAGSSYAVPEGYDERFNLGGLDTGR